MQSTRTLIRRITSGKSLRLTLPREIAASQRLNVGDHVVWTEEEDGVKLKFIRSAEPDELAKSAA